LTEAAPGFAESTNQIAHAMHGRGGDPKND
jgi:hypothetical protein